MACVDRVERDFISRPTFQPNVIRSKSSAAAGLSAWVINICKYFRIYQVGIKCRPATGDGNICSRLLVSSRSMAPHADHP